MVWCNLFYVPRGHGEVIALIGCPWGYRHVLAGTRDGVVVTRQHHSVGPDADYLDAILAISNNAIHWLR